MKKFKFLSKILAVLVIVPAILLCTACGGGQMAQEAKLAKKEFVKMNTAAEFQAEFDKIEETDIATGYHMTMSMKMDVGDYMKFNNFYMNMYYIPGVGEEAPTIASKFDMDIAMGDEMAMTMVGTMYAVDGYSYTDAKMGTTMQGVTANVETKTKAELGYGDADSFLEIGMMYGELSTMLERLPEMMEAEGVEFYKSTDGTQIKIVVAPGTELDGMVAEQVEMTIEFAEGKVTGFSMITKATMVDGDYTAPVEMSVTLTQFTGEIEFPSFEGYTEAEEDEGFDW